MTELKFSEKTKFSVICNVLEKIEKQKNRDQKVEILKQFISSFREQSKNHQNDNFYPILRLLLPHLERERGSYGIKENTLAKMYIRILGLPKEGKDAQKLLNYRAPKTSGKGMGDFAEVAYWVLRSRFENTQKLTVFDVNQHLDNIAMKHASHDPRGVDNELHSMLLNMSPDEQKWLIRIILKDISIGLSQNRILYWFHPDAVDLYDVTNDLQKVCITLKDPNVRLHEIEISLFHPFKPMLSQRCDVQDVDKDINSSDHYYVEIKFDGERFQIHCENGDYKYYSRNGYDYTDTYGCNSSNGVLTPKIAKCLGKDVQSVILDGEMMCWHKGRKCFTTKGMNIDVKYIKDADANQPCFVVFDILYLNGTVLTNKPYVERIKLLEEHITPEEGVFMISNKVKVTSGSEIMDLLNKAIDNCEEGIVIKDPNSIYKPNSRKSGWYKIKPEYTEGLMVELDLLVIGGYYGEGRRRGLVSQFLVAVSDSKKNEDGEPRVFYSVGRVGSGYTMDELAELDKKLQGNWKRVPNNQMPPGIEWTKEKPDVWIAPNLSFILQIKATEVVPSDAFRVGYTLRFPRVQKVRYDKPWTDCLTLDEFTTLRESHCGKLCTSYATKFSSTENSKKQVKRAKKVIEVEEQYQSKKTKNIQQTSNIFEGHEICILTGHEMLKKSDLELKIVEFGGTITQHPGSSTYCVISSNKNNIRVKNLMQLDKYNILKTDWILECIEKKKFVNWSPEHFHAMAPETAEKISEHYDQYGDHYTKSINLHRLKEIMKSADDGKVLSTEEMMSLDKQLFSQGNPFAIFRGCVAYFFPINEFFEEIHTGTVNFDVITYTYKNYHVGVTISSRFEIIPGSYIIFLCVIQSEKKGHTFLAKQIPYSDNLQNKICKQIFKFYGGKETDTIDENTTHIIHHKGQSRNVENKQPKQIHRVSHHWILDSQKSKKRLPETSYFAF